MNLQERLLKVNEELRFEFTQNDATTKHFADCACVYSDVAVELLNGVFMARIEEKNAAERISKIVNSFREQNLPALFWLTPLSKAPNLHNLLKKNGCIQVSVEKEIALDLQSFQVPLELQGQVELREAKSEDELNEWANLFFKNFNLPDFAKPYFLKLISSKLSRTDFSLKNFIASQNGKNIGTISLLFREDIVGIYCVSVVQDKRNQNIGTMLMATTLAHAIQKGFRYLVGSANREGLHVYSKAPIIELGETHLYRI